jgi:hypothetical protein
MHNSSNKGQPGGNDPLSRVRVLDIDELEDVVGGFGYPLRMSPTDATNASDTGADGGGDTGADGGGDGGGDYGGDGGGDYGGDGGGGGDSGE